MEKRFDYAKLEPQLYSFWEQNGYFNAKPDSKKKPFSIILPPPNANANLHLGHAMYVYEDIMIRYHKIMGYETLWLPGADHAGFETQFVYEKHLQKQGKSRYDFDRETLFKDIWNFVMGNRETMENQLRRLGFALDWSKKKFTMDEDIVAIVHRTFKKLFDDGLIYRANRLVNYCTKDGTSFSDLEVVSKEAEGILYYITFPIKGGGKVSIATTRPETMLGDVAVMVNPKDKRYQDIIGKEVELPLTDRLIPVIADEYVDMKFGTGAVKVTPAHDFNDFEIAKKHNLTYPPVICRPMPAYCAPCPGNSMTTPSLDRIDAASPMRSDASCVAASTQVSATTAARSLAWLAGLIGIGGVAFLRGDDARCSCRY